ncbi:MAG: 2-phosphosulfolactate phosphatase [Bacteroidetes bacterium]|jgi:2-phosphosulfolactate phosphatase|nr:2-phosphosulfolactate phosphatase [Bacteroidota bacterium]
MYIEVVGTAQQCAAVDFKGKTAVVIDVLRATSVICTAIYNGAKAVIPTASIEEAKACFAKLQPNTALLCGERNANKIPGFHLGNSPLEFGAEVVNNKTLVMATSNGTLALRQTSEAVETLAGSFLNIGALADYVSKQLNDLVIVCSGTAGNFSLDDALCAGMLISMITDRRKIETDDLAKLVLQFYGADTGNAADKLKECKHLKYLQDKALQQDIDYCLQTALLPVVPRMVDRQLIKT